MIILKKTLIVLSILSGLLFAAVGGWYGYNKLKYEKCYVKITENSKSGIVNPSTGFFDYNLMAYDKKGNEIPVKFWAQKKLKVNAYLAVDVFKPLNKDSNDINSYKEVTGEQLPEKVKEKLNVK
ncbi:YxeA family protein [Bacillus albus]|uniref:YxeA family protein n=1 Tax=Bacillus albus TaxID=2026189 RepID=UPI001F61F8B5|nr:YxeA family protein [Bacillus albus]